MRVGRKVGIGDHALLAICRREGRKWLKWTTPGDWKKERTHDKVEVKE